MYRSDKHLNLKNLLQSRKSRNHATAHRVVSSQWLYGFYKLRQISMNGPTVFPRIAIPPSPTPGILYLPFAGPFNA